MSGSQRWIGLASATVAVLVGADRAEAAYTGLSVEKHTTVQVQGVSHDVYRVYANFNNPDDRFIEVYGSPNDGPATIQSRNGDDTGPGSNFFNTPGGATAPSQLTIDGNPDAQWDTFVTIGVSVADQGVPFDQTSPTPGFAPLSSNEIVWTNAAWYVVPTYDDDGNPNTPTVPPPQTLAGFTGDGDLLNRVMIMQLTVNAGDNVRGTVNVITFNPYPGGSAGLLTGQTFNSVPGPGGFVLAIMGLCMSRRRRRALS